MRFLTEFSLLFSSTVGLLLKRDTEIASTITTAAVAAAAAASAAAPAAAAGAGDKDGGKDTHAPRDTAAKDKEGMQREESKEVAQAQQHPGTGHRSAKKGAAAAAGSATASKAAAAAAAAAAADAAAAASSAAAAAAAAESRVPRAGGLLRHLLHQQLVSDELLVMPGMADKMTALMQVRVGPRGRCKAGPRFFRSGCSVAVGQSRLVRTPRRRARARAHTLSHTRPRRSCHQLDCGRPSASVPWRAAAASLPSWWPRWASALGASRSSAAAAAAAHRPVAAQRSHRSCCSRR